MCNECQILLDQRGIGRTSSHVHFVQKGFLRFTNAQKRHEHGLKGQTLRTCYFLQEELKRKHIEKKRVMDRPCNRLIDLPRREKELSGVRGKRREASGNLVKAREGGSLTRKKLPHFGIFRKYPKYPSPMYIPQLQRNAPPTRQRVV